MKKRDSETDKYTIDNTGTFHDDFNDALSALFSDEDVISKEQALAENQTSVLNQMKELKKRAGQYERGLRRAGKMLRRLLYVHRPCVTHFGQL